MGRATYEGDSTVVNEVQDADARECLRDEMSEAMQHWAVGCERGESGDRSELGERVDSDENLGGDEVLAKPEVQPASYLTGSARS